MTDQEVTAANPSKNGKEATKSARCRGRPVRLISPIENVFHTTRWSSRVRDRAPTTLAELRVAIEEEWDAFVPGEFASLIACMPSAAHTQIILGGSLRIYY